MPLSPEMPPSQIEEIMNRFLEESNTPLHLKVEKRESTETEMQQDIKLEQKQRRLEQFGYQIFRTSSLPSEENIPVGNDYLLGPGDVIRLTVWGAIEGVYLLEITKEGEVVVPKAGALSLVGVRFGDLQEFFHRAKI